ncbi:MAG: methyl-accepting chemotaxis protein, partial [Acidobacteria bacterium]|nr:methyl-accepting chemotaxis protein [Acidobacteriota bacterium]
MMSWFDRFFANWSLGRRIRFMFYLALVVLVLVLLVTGISFVRDQQLAKRIESEDVPAFGLSLRLLESFREVQRGFQDASGAFDMSFLEEVGNLRDHFLEQIELSGERGPLLSEAVRNDLRERFNVYFEQNYSVTENEVLQGPQDLKAIEKGKALRDELEAFLVGLNTSKQKEMNQGFAEADRRRRLAFSFNVALAVFVLLLLWLISSRVSRSVVGGIDQAVAVASRLAEGDIRGEIEVQSRDEVGQLLRAMQRMLQYLQESEKVARSIADGDLTVEATPRSEEDRFGFAFRGMIANLRTMIGNVKEAASQVATSADEISASSGQITEGAKEQSTSTEETSATMVEMAAQIDSVAQSSSALATNVDQTSASIQEMGVSIEQVARSAEELLTSVEETSATIEEMTASINSIEAKVRVVD